MPPSELGVSFTREPDIRDAASLVIVRKSNSGMVSVLMGRRHPNTAFLPNKYVFPGGRFEASDGAVSPAGALSAADQVHLMLSVPDGTHPDTMQALALTAIRETFEETGMVIGTSQAQPQPALAPGWQRFIDTGFFPDISNLHFFARAITPPGRPRRYDTRFFWVSEAHVSKHLDTSDEELDDIGWLTLADARQRDIASITHHILADLARLTEPDKTGTKQSAVPFYFYQNDAFNRVLLSHQDGTA